MMKRILCCVFEVGGRKAADPVFLLKNASVSPKIDDMAGKVQHFRAQGNLTEVSAKIKSAVGARHAVPDMRL